MAASMLFDNISSVLGRASGDLMEFGMAAIVLTIGLCLHRSQVARRAQKKREAKKLGTDTVNDMDDASNQSVPEARVDHKKAPRSPKAEKKVAADDTEWIKGIDYHKRPTHATTEAPPNDGPGLLPMAFWAQPKNSVKASSAKANWTTRKKGGAGPTEDEGGCSDATTTADGGQISSSESEDSAPPSPEPATKQQMLDPANVGTCLPPPGLKPPAAKPAPMPKGLSQKSQGLLALLREEQKGNTERIAAAACKKDETASKKQTPPWHNKA